jgi:hypothetical protein
MPSLLKLALCLAALTLIVPALVWCQSTSWRAAWSAWKQFGTWYFGLLGVALVIWVGMGAPS